MIFSTDQRRFYLDEIPFYPSIGCDDECTVAPIELVAGLEHDLDWKSAREKALELIDKGKWILWHFNFGLEKEVLALEDTARYFSFALAIEEFLKQLWPEFSKATFGASLYKGSINIADRFLWSGMHEKNLKESSLGENLYCVGVLAEYLHRLASHFPDELLPFCFFDISSYGIAEGALLLSKERFAHLHLAVKGAYQPTCSLKWEGEKAYFLPRETTAALLLPSDLQCTPDLLAKLDAFAHDFSQKGEALRIIPELLLNEEWDGLDHVYALENSLTGQGHRRLQGFAAAGGEFTFL